MTPVVQKTDWVYLEVDLDIYIVRLRLSVRLCLFCCLVLVLLKSLSDFLHLLLRKHCLSLLKSLVSS